MMPNNKTFDFVEYGFEFINTIELLEHYTGSEVFKELRGMFCDAEQTRRSNLTQKPQLDIWGDTFVETIANTT